MVSRLRLLNFLLCAVLWGLPVPAILLSGLIHGWSAGWTNYDFSVLAEQKILLMLVTAIWIWITSRYRLTTVHEPFSGFAKVRKVISASMIVGGGSVIFMFLAGELRNSSRMFYVLVPVVMAVLTLLARSIFHAVLQAMGARLRSLRVLVVGSDEMALRTIRRLRNGILPNIKVVGLVSVPGQKSSQQQRIPVFEFAELQSLLTNRIADEVIIALPVRYLSFVGDVEKVVKAFGRPVRLLLDLGSNSSLSKQVIQVGKLQMVTLEESPREKLSYLLTKRAFDVTFSLAVIVTTAPLLLLIALAIKLSSPGPVLFKQQRVGLDGKLFWMLKFRTMKVAATDKSDTEWTTSQMQRKTLIGLLLRKTSLDELPQFFNVLRGDMSVVGPRPERPYFVQLFNREYKGYDRRHNLRVGITGWAQVNGYRGDTSIQVRLEHDIYYIQNWSLWLDLRIVAMTFFAGLINKNAY